MVKFVSSLSNLHNTHKKTRPNNHVQITHSAHPWQGRSFPVIVEAKSDHPELIKIQVSPDEQRLIPINWTDQVTPVKAKPGAYFPIAQLRLLRQRLDGLLDSAENGGTISPLHVARNKGDIYDPRKHASMAEVASQSTTTNYQPTGTNDVAPNKASRGDV